MARSIEIARNLMDAKASLEGIGATGLGSMVVGGVWCAAGRKYRGGAENRKTIKDFNRSIRRQR